MQLRQHRGQRVGCMLHVDDEPRETRRERDQLGHLRRAGRCPQPQQREPGRLQFKDLAKSQNPVVVNWQTRGSVLGVCSP